MDALRTSGPMLPTRREFIARSAAAGSLLALEGLVLPNSLAAPVGISKWVDLGELVLDPIDAQSPSARRLVTGGWPEGFVKAGNFVLEISPANLPPATVPAQISRATSGEAIVRWLAHGGLSGRSRLRLGRTDSSSGSPGMTACEACGHLEIREGNQQVLRYNYAPVDHPELQGRIAEPNRKYAVARSNYIHPLRGLSGEQLTLDWPIDHPHHRGIYWAWPEVDWDGNRGDLHALQRVVSKPTGVWSVSSGPVFAEIVAENMWVWETGIPIVRESALVRCFARGPRARFLDLKVTFEALDKPVRIARRDAMHYGGLNIRLNSIAGQEITKSTTPSWGNISGTFPDAAGHGGLLILQSPANPDFPGDWIEYPKLNWLQPAFPGGGSRYELRKGDTLRLNYRLVVYSGKISARQAESWCRDAWQSFL